MKIGVFGGTFDPPHVGHLALAKAARETLGLDEIVFLPAARNPLKSRRIGTSGADRLAMIRLLIRGQEGMAASDMELTRGGVSYTVDTLGELQMVQPAEYWFLMGADGIAQLHEWRNTVRIAKLCRLAVAVRPPFEAEELLSKLPPEFEGKADLIVMPPVDISSTDIREKFARRKPVHGLTPPEVLRYIEEHRLYQD